MGPELTAQILEEAPAVEAGEAGEVDQLRLVLSDAPGERPKSRLPTPFEVMRSEPPGPRLVDERPAETLAIDTVLRDRGDVLRAQSQGKDGNCSALFVVGRHEANVVAKSVRVIDPRSVRRVERLGPLHTLTVRRHDLGLPRQPGVRVRGTDQRERPGRLAAEHGKLRSSATRGPGPDHPDHVRRRGVGLRVALAEALVVRLVADGVVAGLVADAEVAGSIATTSENELDGVLSQARGRPCEAAPREIGDDDRVRLARASVDEVGAGRRRDGRGRLLASAARSRIGEQKESEGRRLHTEMILRALCDVKLLNARPDESPAERNACG